MTILDRQPGYGGLQIQARDGTWADAPYVPDAFTVNVADLMSRWTGERWRSTRHRVLPPPREAPDEELISLIVFLEAEVDTVIRPVARGTGFSSPSSQANGCAPAKRLPACANAVSQTPPGKPPALLPA